MLMRVSPLLLWLILLLPSLVQAAPPLLLTPDVPSQGAIGEFVAFNDQLPVDAGPEELVGSSFNDAAKQVPNFGLDRGPIWLHVELQNNSNRSGDWILSLNRALLDTLRVLIIGDESMTTLLTLEDRLASYRDYGTLAAPFSLAAGADVDLYILYEGSNSSIIPLTIETTESSARQQRWDLILFFVSLAGVATLIIYNTVIGLISRLSAFLYYGLAQVAMFSYFAHLSGITTIYLWPETPDLGTQVAPILSVLTALFNSLFVSSFIDERMLPRWLFKTFGFIIYASIIASVLMVLSALTGFEVAFLNTAAVLLPSVTVLLLPVAGTLASRERRLRYLPMTVAWYWLAISITYTSLTVTNLAPVVPEFLTLYVGFSFIEAILLSISLALEVRFINESRMTAQQELASSLSAQLEESQRNEQLMRERSMALSDIADRGRLLQAAGHDTRQALFALKQFAAGLKNDAGPERIDLAQRSITQLAKHVDDVLATTLVGAHGGAMVDQVIALEEIAISDLLEPIRLIYQRAAVKKNLKFRIVSRDVKVVTDRVLLIRILSNLVSNAIKYTAEGGVLIGVRVLQDKLCFQVWDTGRGLSDNEMNALFEANHSAKRYDDEQEGLGSGLQTCQLLAEKLQTSFTARSIPDKGSVFELEIPIRTLSQEFSKQCLVFDEDKLSRTWLEQAGWKILEDVPTSGDLPVFIDIDYLSPGGGIPKASAMRDNFPNIVMTSYDHAADIRNACAEASLYLLYKPLEPATLSELAFRISL